MGNRPGGEHGVVGGERKKTTRKRAANREKDCPYPNEWALGFHQVGRTASPKDGARWERQEYLAVSRNKKIAKKFWLQLKDFE